MRRSIHQALATLLILVAGCHLSPASGLARTDSTDREIYRLIDDRQRAALGATSNVDIGTESGDVAASERMYSSTPRPVGAALPPAFQPSREAASTADSSSDSRSSAGSSLESDERQSRGDDLDEGLPPAGGDDPDSGLPVDDELGPQHSASIFRDDQFDQVTVFSVRDALGYAFKHSREFQDAKEALYLAALDRTLERHLWTPQFVARVRAEFTDDGQITGFDQAMSAVSDVAVTQRLPYGGEVTARVINSLVRDLTAHTSTGESGSVILESDIPLLRGAGRTARESLYSSERELIYAVRTFERFRRTLLVDIARFYFDLQQRKSQVVNSFKSYRGRRDDWRKADFVHRVGQSRDISEAPRAKSSFRRAEASLVSAKEQYESALDRFKITLGMPVDVLLDVLDQDADEAAAVLDDLLGDVELETAVDVALRYRLDLINSADRVDDASRGVRVAKNAILPDLDASGSVTLDTDPEHLSSTGYNTERATWSAGIELRVDDRKAERNAYRAAHVAVRRAQRDHEERMDVVRADVRRAIRRISVQDNLRRIQAMQVEENELRLAAARAQYDLGMTTNQDVVDAGDELLAARNDLAAAVSAYRNAILEFRRDTGTVRVDDDGRWQWDGVSDEQPTGDGPAVGP